MANNVRYSKEMKDQAATKKLHLITLSTPGVIYQVAGTVEQVREVEELFHIWMNRLGSAGLVSQEEENDN